MKRRVTRDRGGAGFEKSGHFFFNKLLGRGGYDDGLIFATAVCDMLDRNPGKSMADLKNALPKTWSSPTMSPALRRRDQIRHRRRGGRAFRRCAEEGRGNAGQPIRDLVTVNGVRVTVEDGTSGLVRALRRTSRSWWSWSKAWSARLACATCSKRWTACCARIQRSASIIRRFDSADAARRSRATPPRCLVRGLRSGCLIRRNHLRHFACSSCRVALFMPKHDEAAGAQQLGVERNQVTVADQGEGGDQREIMLAPAPATYGRANGFVRQQLQRATGCRWARC